MIYGGLGGVKCCEPDRVAKSGFCVSKEQTYAVSSHLYLRSSFCVTYVQLAELVYNARTGAGLSQTELARRAGTRQAVISATENGAQAPGGIILTRIAHAIGGTLTIAVAA
jgi:DNA-binding XRE family transcriptional regulator